MADPLIVDWQKDIERWFGTLIVDHKKCAQLVDHNGNPLVLLKEGAPSTATSPWFEEVAKIPPGIFAAPPAPAIASSKALSRDVPTDPHAGSW